MAPARLPLAPPVPSCSVPDVINVVPVKLLSPVSVSVSLPSWISLPLPVMRPS